MTILGVSRPAASGPFATSECPGSGGKQSGRLARSTSGKLPLRQRLDAVSLLAMRIDPSEYARLRSWFSHMVPKVFPLALLTPDAHPVAVLDRMAVKTPAKARIGLGMAIGDVVEFTSDWSASDVTACDHELSQSGLPTLSEVRARFSKLVQRAVRRGHIKSDDEFYALRNAVEQQGADPASLWPLLEAYEART
jgi:hypothetical protein